MAFLWGTGLQARASEMTCCWASQASEASEARAALTSAYDRVGISLGQPLTGLCSAQFERKAFKAGQGNNPAGFGCVVSDEFRETCHAVTFIVLVN